MQTEGFTTDYRRPRAYLALYALGIAWSSVSKDDEMGYPDFGCASAHDLMTEAVA